MTGAKDMHAGKYVLTVTGLGPVMVVGPGGIRAVRPVITTLGRHDQDVAGEFVFDKVDGKSVLAEIWPPKRDGLLLLATKPRHQHRVLGGSNASK